jgi:UDP-3-O-[3-hydroxymyristoyl] glucosamine N-acyltransferase
MADSRFYSKLRSYSLKELADLVGATVPHSQESLVVEDLSSLEKATSKDIAFINRKEFLGLLTETKAGVCIVTQEFLDQVPLCSIPLVTKDPQVAFARIAQSFYPEAHHAGPLGETPQHAAIHDTVQVGPNTHIGEGVEIGAHTKIGAGVTIGSGVKIGNYCQIYDQVTITHTILGDYAEIHSGARIGQPGFGFAVDQGKMIDIPQLGRVIIHDHVRIGANTAIDRGAMQDTVIGPWCRIDNLVQIAHNVTLGAGCIIVAQVGIAGSTEIGDYSILAGQVGVKDHLKIGKGVKVAAQSGLGKDLEDGAVVGGCPAIPIQDWHRQTIALSRLIKRKD